MPITCPSCVRGLNRYREDNGVQADHIVVELARARLDEGWLDASVDKANNGGIKRVLPSERAMGFPEEKPASYEDLFDLPPHIVGEIISGRLVTHPRPAPRHALAYSALGGELQGPFDRGRGGPGGWWVLDEPEIHLIGDILVPDIAGWQRSRMPKLPETAWFDLAPDWLCEILSPSTARVDRIEKLPIYARWGVGHVWLVDPDLRTLEAYENQNGRWVLAATLKDDDPVSLPPFEAISFPLGVLWAD